MDSNYTEGKIRILMCGSDRKEKGGMNSVVEQLINNDWDERYQISYLPTHVSGSVIKKIVFFIKGYINLYVLLKRDMFDIIHIHMSNKWSFYRKYYISKLCKMFHKKVVIHLHGSEFQKFYNESDVRCKKKIKEFFSLVDITIALGEKWCDFIHSITHNANVIIINNAVSIPDIQNKNIKEKRTLIFLGALIERKGVRDLLTALTNLTKEGICNYELLIAGAGEEEEKLRYYVNHNDLKQNVKFLGWIGGEEKKRVLQHADILVLPSYNEGLPIAILEAMSYGLPIISTRVGSIDEAVKDNGFLVIPGDVSGIREALRVLLCDDSVFLQQSLKSREIAERKFSEGLFFARIQEVYESLY